MNSSNYITTEQWLNDSHGEETFIKISDNTISNLRGKLSPHKLSTLENRVWMRTGRSLRG